MRPSTLLHRRLLVMVLTLFVLVSCSEDTPLEPVDDNGEGPPPNTPAIPLPSSPGDILPERSDSLIVSEALIHNFSPTLASCPDSIVTLVSKLGLGLINAEIRPVDRRFDLVVDGIVIDPVAVPCRAHYSDIPIWFDMTYNLPGVEEIPTVQCVRYWRKIFSTVVQHPFNYTESHTYTEGTSETTGESFSYTLGVSAGLWGIGLSAELTRTFSHSITVSSETSVTKEYFCPSASGKTIVFTAWQLVEGFRICNADTTVYTDPEFDPVIPLIDNATNNLYLSTVVFTN